MTTTETATEPSWIAPGEQGFLVGEKLYLRAPEAGDANYALAWHPSPYPIIRQRAEKILKEEFPKDGDKRLVHLIACRRSDDIPVGAAAYDTRVRRTAYVKLHADPTLGDGAAAVKAEILGILVPWLSAETKKMVVWAELDAPTPELLAAADAAGMRPAVRLREAIWQNGARHDQWVYERLHPRWIERLGDSGRGIEQEAAPRAEVPTSRRVSVPRPAEPAPKQALLVGERVALRMMEPDDGKEITRLLRHETDVEWAGGRWIASSQQFARWYEEAVEKDPPAELNLAVILRQSGALIGVMELIDIDLFHRTAETGSVLYLPEHRGQGLGSEAKLLLLEFAFDHLGLHMVRSFVDSYNPRSQAALRKQGYRDAGRLQWTDQTDEGFAHAVLFDLLASEWRARVNRADES
ncbi:MAG: GNAT family N-acetyltransferase [Chloroflexia bacterium]|nr:GNAT family N-acetyltransferase [Chloroflexia bacterium]